MAQHVGASDGAIEYLLGAGGSSAAPLGGDQPQDNEDYYSKFVGDIYMPSNEVFEWVKTIGSLICSWPIVVLFALVLPGEEALLPGVGPALAGAGLKGEMLAGGVGPGGGVVADEVAEVDEVLLSGGALFQGGLAPFVDELLGGLRGSHISLAPERSLLTFPGLVVSVKCLPEKGLECLKVGIVYAGDIGPGFWRLALDREKGLFRLSKGCEQLHLNEEGGLRESLQVGRWN